MIYIIIILVAIILVLLMKQRKSEKFTQDCVGRGQSLCTQNIKNMDGTLKKIRSGCCGDLKEGFDQTCWNVTQELATIKNKMRQFLWSFTAVGNNTAPNQIVGSGGIETSSFYSDFDGSAGLAYSVWNNPNNNSHINNPSLGRMLCPVTGFYRCSFAGQSIDSSSVPYHFGVTLRINDSVVDYKYNMYQRYGGYVTTSYSSGMVRASGSYVLFLGAGTVIDFIVIYGTLLAGSNNVTFELLRQQDSIQ